MTLIERICADKLKVAYSRINRDQRLSVTSLSSVFYSLRLFFSNDICACGAELGPRSSELPTSTSGRQNWSKKLSIPRSELPI